MQAEPRGLLHLRILATSDLHMHLLPYDYLAAAPSSQHGLTRTAALIRQRRDEVAGSLLLDNGDFLQGAPMGDLAARAVGLDQRAPHPAISAMNALGYDAVALGNHDFNYGLRLLRHVVAQARFPVLAANLAVTRGPGFGRWTMIERVLHDGLGRPVRLRIGVIGFLPPQTAEWDRDLTHAMHCDDIIETARRVVPQMRAEGAQLVIALAHSGIGPLEPRPRMEHAATALAALSGIDVVIAGHTHEVFPGGDIAPAEGVDPLRGLLAGKPAVMPGFGGGHLGVIDLALRLRGDGAAHIERSQVRAEAVDPDLPADPAIAGPLARAHRATRRHLGNRVGRALVPLCSDFALLGQDAGLRLVNQAQRWHVRQRLQGTPWQDLPLLSASAPFRAGGRGGPAHYTCIRPGPLTLRHLADLYAFPNRIAAVALSGSQLAEWLERSAGLFARLRPGGQDLPLLDPAFPAYNFDVIEGVTWTIDLSRPARYRPDGSLADPQASRVRDLRHRGSPVAPTDRFVLATNSYRLASCGLFSPLVRDNLVALAGGALTRDILRAYIRRRRHVAPSAKAHWHFAPLPGTTALFRTAPRPEAVRQTPDHLTIEPAGLGDDGFALMRLYL